MKLYVVIITDLNEFEDYSSGYDDGIFDDDDMLTIPFESDSIYGIFDSKAAAEQAKNKFEDENDDIDVSKVSIQEFELNKVK